MIHITCYYSQNEKGFLSCRLIYTFTKLHYKEPISVYMLLHFIAVT